MFGLHRDTVRKMLMYSVLPDTVESVLRGVRSWSRIRG